MIENNSISGIILIACCLLVMGGVIERCPIKAEAPPQNPCLSVVNYTISTDDDIYEERKSITLYNKEKEADRWKWNLGKGDSIITGGLNERYVEFYYRGTGIRTVRLIDKKGNCDRKVLDINIQTPQKETKSKPIQAYLPTPPRQAKYPKTNITQIAGRLTCNEYVQFDAGVNGNYDLRWSFDDLKTISGKGHRPWHKFDSGHPFQVRVRVFIGSKEIGYRDFHIACH